MPKHLKITVEGKVYDVVVEDVTEDAGSTFYQTPSAGMPAPRPASVPSAPRRAGARPGRRRSGREGGAARRRHHRDRGQCRPAGKCGRQGRGDRGDEDEDRRLGPQGRQDHEYRGQGRRRRRSGTGAGDDLLTRRLSEMTPDTVLIPDSVYGAILLSVIDFLPQLHRHLVHRLCPRPVPLSQPHRQSPAGDAGRGVGHARTGRECRACGSYRGRHLRHARPAPPHRADRRSATGCRLDVSRSDARSAVARSPPAIDLD